MLVYFRTKKMRSSNCANSFKMHRCVALMDWGLALDVCSAEFSSGLGVDSVWNAFDSGVSGFRLWVFIGWRFKRCLLVARA